MNPLRHRAVRWPIVLIGCVAWFAISNHCALGSLQRLQKAPAPACHQAPKPEAPSQDDGSKAIECCKILRATLLAFAKTPGSLDQFAFVPFVQACPEVALFLRLPLLSPLELDTGPPSADTFSELVLQRSILAHAPPFVS